MEKNQIQSLLSDFCHKTHSLLAVFFLTAHIINGQSEVQIIHNSTLTSPHLRLIEDQSDYARIKIENNTVANKYWDIAGLTSADDGSSSVNFWYYDGSLGKDIMVIKGNGTVGINQFSPQVTFDVGGKIKLGDDGFGAVGGAMRFASGQFEGYNGTEWISLGAKTKDSIIVGAAAFTSREGDAVTKVLGQGGVYINQNGSDDALVAQATLPVGAVVQEITVYYKDDDATRSLDISLVEESLKFGFFSTEMTVTTADSGASWTSGTDSGMITIFGNAYYFLRITSSSTWPGNSDLAVKGVKIVYDL